MPMRSKQSKVKERKGKARQAKETKAKERKGKARQGKAGKGGKVGEQEKESLRQGRVAGKGRGGAGKARWLIASQQAGTLAALWVVSAAWHHPPAPGARFRVVIGGIVGALSDRGCNIGSG